MQENLDRLGAEFKQAMAHLCAPVTVITAMDGDRPHGTTVSAIMSLSMEPHLLAVALANTSECLGLIAKTKRFGVNVLASEQHDIAYRLAGKGAAKFDGVAWAHRDGLPHVSGASIWIACDVAEVVSGGDHRILLGRVRAVETSTDQDPLTYHRRGFGTHVPHSALQTAGAR